MPMRVLILTDWKEFAEIDLTRLNQVVRFPIVIDGRNLYKPQKMLDHGFTYVSVGRPASYQAQQEETSQAGVVRGDRTGMEICRGAGLSYICLQRMMKFSPGFLELIP